MGNRCYSSQKRKLGIKKCSKGENQKISMYLHKKTQLSANTPINEEMNEEESLLESDKWYEDDRDQAELLFDDKKFQFYYSNYFLHQIYYASNWDNIEVEKPNQADQDQEDNNNINSNKKELDSDYMQKGTKPALNEWRYTIRKGMPLRLARDLIFNMFDLSDHIVQQYDTIYNEIFRERSQSHILITPSFSEDDKNILDNVYINYLTEKGILVLKRLLWCLNDTIPNLQYNPLIVNTVATLFLFLTEEETYFAMRYMLDNSIKQLKAKEQKGMKQLRWHFTLNEEEFHKNSKLFIELVYQKSTAFKQILNHFKKIGYTSYYKVLEDISKKYFANILQYPTVIRIFLVFLNEGVRSFYKLFYSITLLLKAQLLAENDPKKIDDIFYKSKLDESFEDTDKIFAIAYSFKIGNQKKDFAHLSLSNSSIVMRPNKIYYRPRLKEPSEIIKYIQFETIWQWLPKLQKMTNPIKFYSTSKDGYSLQNFYSKCANYENGQMIILIRSDHAVFGAFLDQMIYSGNNKKFYGTEETFVFQLQPNEIIYRTNSQGGDNKSNECQILSKLEYLQIGSNDAAITLEKDLNGFSNASETYNSKPLHNNPKSNQFTALTIELYYLG